MNYDENAIKLVNDMIDFDNKNGSNLLLVGIQILSTLLEDENVKEISDSLSQHFHSFIFSWMKTKDYDFINWKDYAILTTDKNVQLCILQYFKSFVILPHTYFGSTVEDKTKKVIHFEKIKKVSYLDSLLYVVRTENTVMEMYLGWFPKTQSVSVLHYNIGEFSKSPVVESEFSLLKEVLDIFISANKGHIRLS